MPKKNLPYVNGYKDHTGKMRYYLRRPGCRMVALTGTPGSRAFAQSYAAAAVSPKKPRKRHLAPEVGFIYYISDGHHIKIGYTADLEARMRAYRTHAAQPPILVGIHPGTILDERRLHKKFCEHRVRAEWFYPAPELMDHIKETIAELNAA